MSKFDNAIAEAAYEIAGHGFMEEEYGTSQTTGWNALVTVSATTLLNVGADSDLVERFRAEVPGIAGALVWIRENSDGQVALIEHGGDGDRSGGTVQSVERKWNEFVSDMERRAANESEHVDSWEF